MDPIRAITHQGENYLLHISLQRDCLIFRLQHGASSYQMVYSFEALPTQFKDKVETIEDAYDILSTSHVVVDVEGLAIRVENASRSINASLLFKKSNPSIEPTALYE